MPTSGIRCGSLYGDLRRAEYEFEAGIRRRTTGFIQGSLFGLEATKPR